jgi:hypothetical protein
MKKLLMSVAVLALAGVCLAATWTTGTGSKETVTVTPTVYTLTTTVNTLSIYNSDDTDEIHVLAEISTTDFATRYAAGTTIAIPPQSSYTFDARERASIKKICYRTDAGTAVAYIAGY